MKWMKKLCTAVMAVIALAASVWASNPVLAKADTTVDITENVSAAEWITQNELRVTYLSLGEGVIPSIGYGIIDNNAYTYVQEYVAVNGRTIKEINTDETLGASGWTYTVFPSTAAVKYKLPIIVYVNNGKMEIKIHSNYVETLGDRVEITAKTGLYFENGGTRYEVAEDKTFTVLQKVTIVEEDITENVAIEGWDTTGNSAELTYTRLSFGNGVLPNGISYGILDNPTYTYMQEYIALNGKTVKQINEETDTSNYVFSTFPSTADVKYKLPIIIYVNGNVVEIKVHNEFIKTLEGDLVITVKSGLSILNGNKKYLVTQDVSHTLSVAIEEKEIAETLSLDGWAATGDAEELTYARLSLGEGVLPNGIYYDILDKPAYMYLQEYILINGKTVKQINEETDVSDYAFSTFPSTADEKYKLPIIVFENAGVIELKIHNAYVETLGDTIEITVKEGLYVLNGNVRYTLGKDVNYILAGNVWADKDKTYTITYFLNGEQYGEIEQLPYNTPFVLRGEPQDLPAGYAFDGWEGGDASNVVQDMQIYGYTTAICYHVTYHLNGGVNDSANPIVYYVMDGEIVLKDATKEGAVFKGWYTSEDYKTKVERLSPEQLGDKELYALFEGGETDSESGCGSTISQGSSLVALAGAVFLFKRKRRDTEK